MAQRSMVCYSSNTIKRQSLESVCRNVTVWMSELWHTQNPTYCCIWTLSWTLQKKFRSLTKVSNDSYTDFAFKLTNLFKRWLEGLNAYNNVEQLCQVLMMEQFMEMVPHDMKLWLIDQKTKTIEEMARCADNFVTLHKSASQTESWESIKRIDSANVLAFKSPLVSPKPFIVSSVW